MFKTKEQANEFARKWRQENPEKIKMAQKKYYDANREKRLANTRSWEERNPERARNNRRRGQPKRKEWKKANPDKVRAGYRRQRYGITPERFEELVRLQNNLCAICHKSETVVDYRTGELRALSVDHNHETDQPRELLCRRCNSGIGMFDEEVELLRSAIQYLEKHSNAS